MITRLFCLLCFFIATAQLPARTSIGKDRAHTTDLREANYTASAADTLPPDASEATRARYAKDIEELERMKEKFRQQQERKLRREDRGGVVATPRPVPVAPATALDSMELRSGVRSGLYSDQRPAAYERRAWENNVGTGLPAAAKGGEAESSQIDEAYEQKLREVEALRAQLQQARGGSVPAQPSAIVVPPSNLPVTTTTAPVAPTVPAESTGSSALTVTFIPNTAYPNSGGYTGLDEIVAYIKQAASIVEIRVHTGRELSARAAQLLSEERATTIRNYLAEAGIAAANFRVIGFGNHESAAGERVEVITAR